MSDPATAPGDDPPVVFKAVDPVSGALMRYVPLSAYEELSSAALRLCERMSALPQVHVHHGDDMTVLEIVRGTIVAGPDA